MPITVPGSVARETPGDLDGVVDGLRDGQGDLGHALAQRLAFQQLRDQVGATLVGAHVVNDEDVRVIE